MTGNLTSKPKWLQLCLLLVTSLLFNHVYATPTKFVRQATEQVQQVVVRHSSSTPLFVQQATNSLKWYDIFSQSHTYPELNVSMVLNQRKLLCLNISQAPPVFKLLLPQSDDEALLS